VWVSVLVAAWPSLERVDFGLLNRRTGADLQEELSSEMSDVKNFVTLSVSGTFERIHCVFLLIAVHYMYTI
jgi:hypothetical protein